jgi:hypothetical protein
MPSPPPCGISTLSAAFLYQVWWTENLSLDLDLQDLAQGWRVPGYICSGAYEITVIFLKDLFRLKRADSFYRVRGFKCGHPVKAIDDLTVHRVFHPESAVLIERSDSLLRRDKFRTRSVGGSVNESDDRFLRCSVIP